MTLGTCVLSLMSDNACVVCSLSEVRTILFPFVMIGKYALWTCKQILLLINKKNSYYFRWNDHFYNEIMEAILLKIFGTRDDSWSWPIRKILTVNKDRWWDLIIGQFFVSRVNRNSKSMRFVTLILMGCNQFHVWCRRNTYSVNSSNRQLMPANLSIQYC